MGILQEPIWLNQNITVTVDSKFILWKLWITKGVLNVTDLLDSEGNFLSLNDFNIKYNLQCSFIDHLRIRQVLPQSWRNTIYTQKIKKVIENVTCNITFMDGKTKNFTYCKSNEIYWLMTNQQGINKQNCIDRWHSQYEIAIELWPNIFVIPFRACRETYLQSFQDRLIYRIIPCNNWLYKLKVTDTNQCTYRYCSSNEIDDIKHFLVTCDPVLKFWDTFLTWWNRMNLKKINPLTEVNIMLGFDCQKDEDLVLNVCLMLAKYYIYVADIRGGRDKDDNSSVRLDHLLTQRHTPHPHCPPGVGGNTFPRVCTKPHIIIVHLHISIQTVSPIFIIIDGLRTPTPARVAEPGVSVLKFT